MTSGVFHIRTGITKLDESRRQAFGWAYVSKQDGTQVIDHSDEFVDTPDLENAAYDFVLASREANDMHEGPVIGHLIESVVVTKDKLEAWGIPGAKVNEGWWVGFQLDKDNFEKVKANRTAFSIEGIAQRVDV